MQGCHEHYGRLIGTPGKISVTLQLNYRHNTTTLHTIIIRIHVTPRLNYRSYATIRLTGVIRIWITFTAWRKARPTDAILQNVETKSAKDNFEAEGDQLLTIKMAILLTLQTSPLEQKLSGSAARESQSHLGKYWIVIVM